MVSKTDPDAARIVTAVATSSGAIQEHTQVPELLTRHWMVTGEKPDEVVADAGYGITSTYEFLSRSGITANIPYRHARDVRREKKQMAGFRYDSGKDVYVCPEGKTLYKMSTPRTPGHVLYMVSRCACHGCPRYGMLCKTKRPSIVRTERDELLRKVEEYRRTPAAQTTFRRRKCSVEPAFGEFKTARGVRQANLRGKWKVQV